jgi:hypothetical protein
MPTETAESLAHQLQTTLRGSLKIGDDVITPPSASGWRWVVREATTPRIYSVAPMGPS